MEKKTKTKDVYKTVKSGTKEVEIYIASDGREFTGKKVEQDCSLYELALLRLKKWQNVTHINTEELIQIPDEWWLASDEEELEMVKSHVGFYDKYNFVSINGKDRRNSSHDLKVGEWIGYVHTYGGDSRGDIDVYTISYIQQKLKEFHMRFVGF